ncbi:hypothetical protein [Streptomyces lutosisoli]|uniref:Transposase n=1 Tax=Streptomyces lutosisoli TaxID=2665721 RepID=A0ABW2VTC7_9ACTN
MYPPLRVALRAKRNNVMTRQLVVESAQAPLASTGADDRYRHH